MPGRDALSLLVVDDDPDICEALQTVLEAYGYRVLTAPGGAEALAILRRGERPCLILLDLMMPGMNGAEFRAEQLRDPALARIPVVVLSASGEVAAKAAALGAEGLPKPVDLEALLRAIRHRCRDPGTAPERRG
jgi:CheY-like chemotaxis protein